MASVKVFNMDGAEVSTIELNAAIFDVEPNETAVHNAAVALMNAKRQGNAETKRRGEVHGTGAKPFRQKGTGRARQGSMKNIHMRGGGVAFGPHKRSYRQNVPVRVRRQALCSALTDRVRNDALCVMDALTVDAVKTKPFATMTGKFSPEGRNLLLVTAGVDKNVTLSARNIPYVSVVTAADVNVVDVLKARRVVVVQDALAQLEERLS